MAKGVHDPLELVGTTLDERYRIDELVDEGGFGYVYKAHRVMWDKPVAVKFFKYQTDDPKKQEDQEKAFISEGKLLSELSRKTTSIVQSFDIGTWVNKDGTRLMYTVLEWLEGTTLAALVEAERKGSREGSGWPLMRVIETIEPVAVALSVAHANGVAHRDIKPANIFLVREEDGTTTTKLLDFGIAKVVEDRVEGFDKTGHDTGPYTPKYGAPEQIAKRHGATGPWTDVYSLAMVCVELLCGRYPFSASSFGNLVFAVCDPAERPTPRALGVEVSDEVERVFARALAVKSDDRHRDVGAFWSELVTPLKRDLTGEPPSAGRIATLRSVQGLSFNPPPASSTSAGSVPPSSGTTTTGGAVADGAPTSPPAARSRGGLMAVGLVVAIAIGAGAWLFRARAPTAAPVTSASASASTGEPRASSRIDRERLASFSPLSSEIQAQSNPISEEKVRLGRMLFFDPRLSKNGDVSCSSCHDLAAYGVDGRRVSIGTARQEGHRNALSVFNAAGAFALMWDGVAPTIEAQAKLPLFNPREMAMDESSVLLALKASAYEDAFARAFPGARPAITVDHLAAAIGAFERKLVTPSRWDAFLRGDDGKLDYEEKAGFNTFVEVGCPTCHFGPYVGLTMFQKLGLVKAWPDNKDRGRYELTKQDADLLVFRVPSLRNIARTGPYFHDGAVSDLSESVRLMARHQLGKELSDAQVKAVVSWLGTLTGAPPAELIAKPELPPARGSN
jgi:cytochrome c peroxidase